MSRICTHAKHRLAAVTQVDILVAVVLVLIVLLAIAIPVCERAQVRAKVARVQSDFRTLATAIDAYTVDYDQPPTSPRNYAWDGTQGVWKRVDGPLILFSSLTTPFAYVPSLDQFLDPFFNDEVMMSSANRNYIFMNFTTGVRAINSLTWCGEPQKADLNWFWPGQGASIRLKSVPVMYCFNGNKAKKYPATWSLVSMGPSGEPNEIRNAAGDLSFTWEIWVDADTQAYGCYIRSAAGSFYDASNGTKSLGHLWRFSSGGMNQ